MVLYLVLLVGLASDMMPGQEQLYIDFKRSGGFAGIETTVEIHGDSLTSEELTKLINLIEQSGFFSFDKDDSNPTKIPDQFEYHIVVKYKSQQRKLDFWEGSIPKQFSELFRFLTQKARSQSGN